MTLGERGQRLYDALCDHVDDGGLVLLEEAARIADRLDRLDALLRGDADVWCRLVEGRSDDGLEIKVDAALSEARQQAATLRQLLSGLKVKGSDDGDDDWLAGLDPSLRDATG